MQGKLNYKQKLGLGVSSISALYLLPTVVQGAVQSNTTSFTVTHGFGTDAEWDIDGDSNNDFFFDVSSSSYTYIDLIFGGTRNGRGVVRANADTRSGNIRVLAANFSVGPTLATGYNWAPGDRSYYTMIYNNIIDDHFKGASIGANYFGFRFDIGGNNHYGWAKVTLSLAPDTVVVNEWAYESTPDVCIAVGQTTGNGVAGCNAAAPPIAASVESTTLLALSGLSF